jgi:hypothetical protein
MSLLKECVIALLSSGEDGTVRSNGLRALGVAEAEARHRAGLEVLADHVEAGGQLHEEFILCKKQH